MSIYASLPAPDDDGLPDEETGRVLPPPLVYYGSHILPDGKRDSRAGWVDVALIPAHVTRDGRDNRSEDEGPWPYLRLGVKESTVVLERAHVEVLARSLTWWLEATREPEEAAPLGEAVEAAREKAS